MKISAISQVSTACEPRHYAFIRYSNSFMSVPENGNPYVKANEANPQVPEIEDEKKGIETLENSTIFPKETINGKTVITA